LIWYSSWGLDKHDSGKIRIEPDPSRTLQSLRDGFGPPSGQGPRHAFPATSKPNADPKLNWIDKSGTHPLLAFKKLLTTTANNYKYMICGMLG
jgi:hypothetical protein